MVKNKLAEDRIQSLVAEILAYEAHEECRGKTETMDDVEAAMIRIGDMVAREFGRQKLAQITSQTTESPPCPKCGRAGQPQGRQTRDLATRRGEVPLTEMQYYCPKCRRSFFPSVDGART